jgi:hypothetical protein
MLHGRVLHHKRSKRSASWMRSAHRNIARQAWRSRGTASTRPTRASQQSAASVPQKHWAVLRHQQRAKQSHMAGSRCPRPAATLPPRLTNCSGVGAAQVAPAGAQAEVALPRRHEALVLHRPGPILFIHHNNRVLEQHH